VFAALRKLPIFLQIYVQVLFLVRPPKVVSWRLCFPCEVGICEIGNRAPLNPTSRYISRGYAFEEIKAFSLYVTFDVRELLCDLSFNSHGIFADSVTCVETNSCTAARGIMILGPVSLVDCVVFVLFLLPNLLVQVGLVQILSLIKVIPFLGTFSFLLHHTKAETCARYVDGTCCVKLTKHQQSNCRTNLFGSGTC
jgi:hypothetical protein